MDRRARMTSKYVRHILRDSYRYSVVNGKEKVVNHARLQPEIREQGFNDFLIKLPYHDSVGHQLVFSLIQVKGYNWIVVTEVHYLSQLLNRLPYHSRECLSAYVNELLTKYQIGHPSKDVFYVPLIDYSLQSAYYRLTEMILQYSGAVTLAVRLSNHNTSDSILI